MKTIKELEKSIGVSKVSIYSMLKRAEFKNHIFKGEKNITLIDEVGEEILKTYYSKEKMETIKDILEEDIINQEEKTVYNKADCKAGFKDSEQLKNADMITVLQEQINKKDEQINNLLNIVLNQQKLQGVQLLTNNHDGIDKNNNANIKEKETKNFWQKVFKK